MSMKKFRFRPSPIETPAENPFKNCELNREKDAHILNKIIENSETGFVMALNNEWGAGKTTFLKMWELELQYKHKYMCIYLNTWEHDIEDEPLACILGELSKLNPKDKIRIKKAVKSILPAAKELFPALIKAGIDQGLNKTLGKDNKEEIFTKLSESVVDGLNNILNQQIENYKKRKTNLEKFRKEIKEYINEISPDKPLIFIIDELDRCRPDYAVTFLEHLKHFFSVENIIFVVSIDKDQLGHAVKGYYGNDNINTEEYLRKFFDFEYSIQKPSASTYYKYLLKYYNLLPSLNNAQVSSMSGEQKELSDLYNICQLLFSRNYVPLRKQESIFAYYNLVWHALGESSWVNPLISFTLVFIKFNEPDKWKQLRNKQLDLENLSATADYYIKFNQDFLVEGILEDIELLLMQMYGVYSIHKRYKAIRFSGEENVPNGFKRKTSQSSIENYARKLDTIANSSKYQNVFDEGFLSIIDLENWN